MQARGRALHLESTAQVKERELERLGRSLNAASGAHAEASAAQGAAEEVARRLDGELAQARVKVRRRGGKRKRVGMGTGL